MSTATDVPLTPRPEDTPPPSPDATAQELPDRSPRGRLGRRSVGLRRRLDPRTPVGRRGLVAALIANGLVVGVVWWWWQTSKTTTNPSSAPPPGDVWDGVWRLTVGDLNYHTVTSLTRVVIAVAVALVVGGVAVVVASVVPVLQPMVNGRLLPFLNSMPAFGWAIWGIAWFGAGDFSVTFIVTMILLPFSMVSMGEGLRSLDSGLREMGRSLTRRRLAVFREIEFPLLLPFVFSAARLAFGVGFKVALIAEFFGADEGLGLVLNRSRQTFDPSLVWASILTVVLIAFVIERVVFRPIGNRIARMSGAELAATSLAPEG